MNGTVIDIETAAIPDLPDPPESYLMKGVGSNWKDASKIEAKRRENLVRWSEEAALDWRSGQIICVGYMEGDDSKTVLQDDSKKEDTLIGLVWSWLSSNQPVIGFNLRSFDIPFLIGRSAVNGLTPPRRFNLARYRFADHPAVPVDWCDILSFHGSFDYTGWRLEDYARHFNLKHRPIGDGSEIPRKWAEGDRKYVHEHNEADLKTIAELHERFAPYFLGE